MREDSVLTEWQLEYRTKPEGPEQTFVFLSACCEAPLTKREVEGGMQGVCSRCGALVTQTWWLE